MKSQLKGIFTGFHYSAFTVCRLQQQQQQQQHSQQQHHPKRNSPGYHVQRKATQVEIQRSQDLLNSYHKRRETDRLEDEAKSKVVIRKIYVKEKKIVVENTEDKRNKENGESERSELTREQSVFVLPSEKTQLNHVMNDELVIESEDCSGAISTTNTETKHHRTNSSASSDISVVECMSEEKAA